ncbi:MAG: TraB/GumN family protein [Limisphaerales bacterium]
MPFAALNQQKPSMVMLSMSMIELRRLGVSQKGVDFILYDRAIAAKKKTHGLESVEKQINMLTSLGMQNPDDLIEHTLKDLTRMGELMEMIIKAWRTGDRKTLNNTFIVDLKKQYPDFYKSLFVDRNQSWMPHFEKYLGTKEIELVLVGAGHIVGEDGVIALLEKAGCKVEQIVAKKGNSK